MIVLSHFRDFTHYELFVCFRSLDFGFKINRIAPLLVIISSKLPAFVIINIKITNNNEISRNNKHQNYQQ